jgi:hypothetical protein
LKRKKKGRMERKDKGEKRRKANRKVEEGRG